MSAAVEKEKSSISLWAFILAFTVAVASVIGMATPAWADVQQVTADNLASSLTGSEGGDFQISSGGAVSDVITLTGGTWNLDLNGQQLSTSQATGFKISARTTLNITSSQPGGKIAGSSSTYLFAAVGNSNLTFGNTVEVSNSSGVALILGGSSQATVETGAVLSSTSSAQPVVQVGNSGEPGTLTVFGSVKGENYVAVKITANGGKCDVKAGGKVEGGSSTTGPAIQAGTKVSGELRVGIVNIAGTVTSGEDTAAITLPPGSSCNLLSGAQVSGGGESGGKVVPAIFVGTNDTPPTGKANLDVQAGASVRGNEGPAIVVKYNSGCSIAGSVSGGNGTKNAAAVIVGDSTSSDDKSTLTMTGGSISGVNASGISVFNGASAAITGGTVTGADGYNGVFNAGDLVVGSQGSTVGPTIAGSTGIAAVDGTTTINSGTITGGTSASGEIRAPSALYVQANGDNTKVTIDGGTIGSPDSLYGAVTKVAAEQRGDITVDINGGTIYGVASSSDEQGAGKTTITIAGGTIETANPNVESANYAVSNDQGTTITVTDGATVNGDVQTQGGTTDLTGGIIKGNVSTSDDGTTNIGALDEDENGTGAGPTVYGNVSGSDANGEPKTNIYGGSFGGEVKNVNPEPPFDEVYENSDSEDGGSFTGNATDVSVTYKSGSVSTNPASFKGTVKPNLLNNEDVQSVEVDHVASTSGYTDESDLSVPDKIPVANNSGQNVNVVSPQGTVVAPAGSTVISASPYAPTPGDPSSIQSSVAGVKNQVVSTMAPYASVAPNSAFTTWTIEATETGSTTPLQTVANDLIVPILGALNRGGSQSATSAQVESIKITLPGTTEQQQSFALQVLENAVKVEGGVEPTMKALALPDTATLGDLAGMTCAIVATTNNGTLTYTFNFVGEGETEPPAITESEPVYRLYNPFDYLHLYTSDTNEVNILKAAGWVEDFDGEPCWYAPAAGSDEASYEVIRLYNPYSHDHYFVKASDTTQIDFLVDLGWQEDSEASVIWSAADTDANVEVYTLFNPYNQVDTHLWTADKNEVDTLVKPNGWELNTPIIWGVQPTTEAE